MLRSGNAIRAYIGLTIEHALVLTVKAVGVGLRIYKKLTE